MTKVTDNSKWDFVDKGKVLIYYAEDQDAIHLDTKEMEYVAIQKLKKQFPDKTIVGEFYSASRGADNEETI